MAKARAREPQAPAPETELVEPGSEAAARSLHAQPATPAHWRNRIVGEGLEDPHDLLAHPKNFRLHPPSQIAALSAVLDDIGVVQRVIKNRTTGRLLDGHLRVELACQRGEPVIPVVYVELSEAEEEIVLASLDHIGGLATIDRPRLDALLERCKATSPRMDDLLARLKTRKGRPPLE